MGLGSLVLALALCGAQSRDMLFMDPSTDISNPWGYIMPVANPVAPSDLLRPPPEDYAAGAAALLASPLYLAV